MLFSYTLNLSVNTSILLRNGLYLALTFIAVTSFNLHRVQPITWNLISTTCNPSLSSSFASPIHSGRLQPEHKSQPTEIRIALETLSLSTSTLLGAIASPSGEILGTTGSSVLMSIIGVFIHFRRIPVGVLMPRGITLPTSASLFHLLALNWPPITMDDGFGNNFSTRNAHGVHLLKLGMKVGIWIL